MFTSNILYIFFHLLSSRLYAVFRFVARQDIYFIFALMTWPEYLFLKKNDNNKTSKSLSESSGHPIRDTWADPEGDRPPFLC